MNFRRLAAAVLTALALGGCCGEDDGSTATLFSAMCMVEEEKAEPASGLWWNPQEDGRGFFIERQGEQVSVGAYVFEEDGRATWSTGRATRDAEGRYNGTLLRSTGGQTLTGDYRAPGARSEIASVVLSFDSTTAGSLEVQLAGRTDKHVIALEQFRGDGGPPSNATFTNGAWWNREESGRIFQIEVQGDNARLVTFVFNEAGEPVWYSGRGTLATTASFTVPLTQMADGQTLTGPYRKPTTVSTTIGSVTFQASAADRATLTQPDGRQIPVERLGF